jgi:hypothetical protein
MAQVTTDMGVAAEPHISMPLPGSTVSAWVKPVVTG